MTCSKTDAGELQVACFLVFFFSVTPVAAEMGLYLQGNLYIRVKPFFPQDGKGSFSESLREKEQEADHLFLTENGSWNLSSKCRGNVRISRAPQSEFQI